MIDQRVRDTKVMLATQSKSVHEDVHEAVEQLTRSGDYIFDVKWDGVRCLALVDRGHVQLINRRGVDITFRYPEVIAALGMYDDRSLVLDGEIVCLGDDGLPDFARVHRRDAQQGGAAIPRLMVDSPATYVAFDLLYLSGDDLRNQPYVVRRALLNTLSRDWQDCPNLMASVSSEDGEEMWNMVCEKGLEGLIAKRKTGLYRSGRNSAWTKLKPTRTLSAMVSGVDNGKGWRADTFGALHIALLGADSTIVQIGKVGSGFDTKDLALVKERIESGVPLIIEVEFQDVSPDKKLRFPVFKGIRDDLTVLDCTVDQIEVPKHQWRS